MTILPTETMEEILVKLPVKDLLRFKCVCKDWLSLITSQRFIDRHYSDKSKQACQLLRLDPISRNEEQCFYCFYLMCDDNRRFLRYEEVNFHQHLPFCNGLVSDLMGPVNGIFCIRFISGDLALSNPAMRELRPLPRDIPDILEYDFLYSYRYAFGFGCDLCGNLKVVALIEDKVEFCLESSKTAYVYNSITDSWKKIENQITYWSIWRYARHTFVNGVYYWFAEFECDDSGILAFDMRSHNFFKIEIPDYAGVSKISEIRIVGHGDSMALSLRKYTGCRHGFNGNTCVGEIWPQLDGRSMALDLCTPPDRHKYVRELWVMSEEGLWGRTWRAEADWILPYRWSWVNKNKNGVVHFTVGSDQAYKESLVSIKREGEGEDDSIRAFLQQINDWK